LSAPASADELGKRDVELHCAIARAAGNEMILRNLEQIFARESPYNLHSLYTGPGTAAVKAWQEHRAIVAAIAAGDPDAAERSMRTHLRNGLQRLRGSLG
jgi:DNA-binding FadR family transcriptional regulator